jgi:zinc protease
MTARNRVVLVSAPEKEGLEIPDETRLREILDRAAKMEISPYKDTSAAKPLLPSLPEPGKIVETTAAEDLKITEWRLANGVRVILRPTDFKADEVLVRAFSPGGTSLVEDKDYVASATAAMVVPAGGLGGFSAVDLDKALAGKAASVRPFVGEVDEGLMGSASPKDLETLFQLIYLTFTAPRCDPEIFGVLTTQFKTLLANRAASPEVAFQDALQTTLSRNHFRARPMTVELVAEMDLDKSCAFYKDRFADASDFTFVFVGNLDLEALRPLVERYLGALPSIHRSETWRDLDVDPPPGVVEKEVRRGVEPKSRTAIVFSGPFKYDQAQRTAIRGLGLVLESRLREIVREELSGTYGVTVRPAYAKVPDQEYSLSVGFGSDPARMEELTRAVFREIESLRTDGPTDKEVSDAREALLREHETGRKENGWLIAQLASRYQLGEDPGEILNLEESFRALSPEIVRQAARAYLDPENYVRVTLYPESRPEKEI